MQWNLTINVNYVYNVYVYHFDPVWIRENSKYCQSCAPDCFIKP